jgi:beta-N-acetylhexosaminidase
VRSAIDAARRQERDVVVVDMGWPAPDRKYADVATFGASRFVGQALLQWINTQWINTQRIAEAAR